MKRKRRGMRWTTCRSVSTLSTRQARVAQGAAHRLAQRGVELQPRCGDALRGGLEAADADAHLADALGIGGAQLLEFGGAQPQHLGRGGLLVEPRAVVAHLARQGTLILGQAADFGPLAGPQQEYEPRQHQGVEQQITIHGGLVFRKGRVAGAASVSTFFRKNEGAVPGVRRHVAARDGMVRDGPGLRKFPPGPGRCPPGTAGADVPAGRRTTWDSGPPSPRRCVRTGAS